MAVGVFVSWAYIFLWTKNMASYDLYPYIMVGGDSNTYFFIVILIIFSGWRANSLIGWGNRFQKGTDLPDFLKNASAKALKQSSSYLLVAIGVLLVVNFIYHGSHSIYKNNYSTQVVKYSNELQKIIQADPSKVQLVCQPKPA